MLCSRREWDKEPMGHQDLSVFISHNVADKDFGRKLGAALALAGAEVWYDEWSIRPGDSIPGAIEKGLTRFSTFALLWSRKA